MAGGVTWTTEGRRMTRGAKLTRALLLVISFGFLGLLLLAPLGAVLVQALAKGLGAWLESFSDPDTISSIRLTLLTAAIVVPANTIFGICAAWTIARFEFRGKSLLVTLIDLPFAVSPVIAGLVLVFLFGVNGWFGEWLLDRNIPIIFAVPGIVLATIFISFPYVARELIPLMQQQGSDEEVAALSLGAGAVAHLPAHHTAEDPLGTPLRRDPVQRPRDGRVRRGLGRLGPHPRRDEHDAAAGRDPLQRIQLRRRIRGRLAPRDARDPHTGG